MATALQLADFSNLVYGDRDATAATADLGGVAPKGTSAGKFGARAALLSENKSN